MRTAASRPVRSPTARQSSAGVSTVRAQLDLSRQFDTLSADLRCLAEALDGQPSLPPRGRPVEAVPLAIDAASDSRYPNPPQPPSLRPGLATSDVLDMEDRTFRLLASLNAAPKHTGPLTDVMLEAANPPPYKPRAQIRVTSRPATMSPAPTVAKPADLLPPIDDADLQPEPNTRLPDASFSAQRMETHGAASVSTAEAEQRPRQSDHSATTAAQQASVQEGAENAGWPDETPLPSNAYQVVGAAVTELHAALGGGSKRVDHAALAQLLGGRTVGELHVLRTAYQHAYGTDCAAELHSHERDTACKFEEALLLSKAELDASVVAASLQPALDAQAHGKRVDTARMVDWNALLEVLCASRPKALVALQEAYAKRVGGSALDHHLTGTLANVDGAGGAPRAVSGEAAAVLNLLHGLLRSAAHEADKWSTAERVAADAEALREAFSGNAPRTDTLLSILPLRTPEHRRAVVAHADAYGGTPIGTLVRSRLQGIFMRAVSLLVDNAASSYYPHMIHAACHGLKATPALNGLVTSLGHTGLSIVTGVHADTLVRVLSSRYGRDLHAITAAYAHIYHKDLCDDTQAALGSVHAAMRPLVVAMLSAHRAAAGPTSSGAQSAAASAAALAKAHDALPNANRLGVVQSAHEHRWNEAPLAPPPPAASSGDVRVAGGGGGGGVGSVRWQDQPFNPRR